MKDSKKRDHLKKREQGSRALNLESWDENDLEDADEKMLEKRLHQLKLQLQMAQDEKAHDSNHSYNKHKKKRVYEDFISTGTDSSNSDSSSSNNSIISAFKCTFKKSSTNSDYDKRKYRHSSLSMKKSKCSRESSRGERENNLSAKFDKKSATKKKVSPVSDKYTRRKSLLIDKREVYSRIDTDRWHEKAKELEKKRIKSEVEHEKPGARSRTEINRSISRGRDQRTTIRNKVDRPSKRSVARGSATSSARRMESPEPSKRAGVSYNLRRTTTITRKISPRDERTTRRDDRRIDLKVTRKNQVRSDVRDVNLRIIRDVREHKDMLPKASEKIREREITNKLYRDVVELGCVESRDRSRVNEERFKERDKRIQDRFELTRNARNPQRHDSRDSIDEKFRRNGRPADASRGGEVFDRMRSRYNDRRNAENCQHLGRPQVDEKKDRQLDKGSSKLKNNMTPIREKSPLHHEKKDSEKVPEKRSRINVDRRSSNFLNVRRIRESETCLNVKSKSAEDNDSLWNKKKPLNKPRSRSRSSERRRRRKSSQEEWHVIDMTSPVLDDDFSDDNSNLLENDAQNKTKKAVPTPELYACKIAGDGFDDLCGTTQNKSMLTYELSDISDEDFNEVIANIHYLKNRKGHSKIKPLLKSDKVVRNPDQNDVSDHKDLKDNKTVCMDTRDATDHVDDIITDRKLQPEGRIRIDLVKEAEDIDSEEDSDLLTVSRVSDALGMDWADLVEESKKRTPISENASFDIRGRWRTNNIFARIGVSEKYAGEELFNQIEKDILMNEPEEGDYAFNTLTGKKTEKFLHKVACLHVFLKSKAAQRRMLFESYKTAMSARKDIAVRRKLCYLPVKNLRTQQMIGICHWIV